MQSEATGKSRSKHCKPGLIKPNGARIPNLGFWPPFLKIPKRGRRLHHHLRIRPAQCAGHSGKRRPLAGSFAAETTVLLGFIQHLTDDRGQFSKLKRFQQECTDSDLFCLFFIDVLIVAGA